MSRNYYFLCLLGLLSLSEFAGAQTTHPGCNTSGCPTPPEPAQPTITPNPSLLGDYEVKVYNSDPYSWIVWSTGQTSPGNWSDFWAKLPVADAATGSYGYQARRCIYTGQSTLCSSWSPTATVHVLRTPGNPAIIASVPACGSLSVNWSPAATAYPTPTHEKRYDLQQSIDNGSSWQDVPGRVNTVATSWSHPDPAASFAYRYRVRAFYVWSGYSSAKTGWISTTITSAACPPFIPDAPALSQPLIAGTDVALSWSAPLSQGYTLNYPLERRNATTGSAWTEIYSGAGTAYTDTGATALGNTYEYRVRACTPVPNCGAWSSTLNFDLYQVVDLEYEYDVLGRLIRLVQDGSTKAGYCYDPAGNRRQVSANGGGGEDCPASPPPTGLSVAWATGPSWKISWTPVIGATGYTIRLNNGALLNVPGGSVSTVYSQPGPNEPPENARPDWIQACFAVGGCGAPAYFPN